MKNIQKTKDWIEMALEDMEGAIADRDEGRYPSSVFHAQQCTEKLLKAVLYFFGMVHGKTHFPSDILVEDVLSNSETTRELQLTKEQIGVLLTMVDHASSIEKQRSMPSVESCVKYRIMHSSLPRRWESSWTLNRGYWYFICFACIST